jgi:hypothetical protein
MSKSKGMKGVSKTRGMGLQDEKNETRKNYESYVRKNGYYESW